MRIFKRDQAAPPHIAVVAAIDLAEMVNPDEMPPVVDAMAAVQAAVERTAELTRELAEWQAKVVKLDETGPVPDLDVAEQRVRDLSREVKWSGYALARAEAELASARATARWAMRDIVLKLAGQAQQAIADRAGELIEANRQLMHVIERAEAIGFRPGAVIEQVYPGMHSEQLAVWRKRARWLPHADVAAIDSTRYVEVIIKLRGAPPIMGVAVGERCWIPRSSVLGLLAQFPPAIAFAGDVPKEFAAVPSEPPAADDLGDIDVRFTEDWLGKLPGGAQCFFRAGQVAHIPAPVAWVAVCQGSGTYDITEPAAEPATDN